MGIPVLLSRARHAWSIQAENGDFGTTGAIIRSIYLAIVSLVLIAVVAAGAIVSAIPAIRAYKLSLSDGMMVRT